MKRIVLGILASASFLFAADFNGVWEGPLGMKDREGHAVVMHVRLKQDANKLSGELWTREDDPDEPRPIQNGTVSGNQLHFEVPQKGELVVSFDLLAEGDALNGAAKFQGPNGPQEIKLSLKRAASQ